MLRALMPKSIDPFFFYIQKGGAMFPYPVIVVEKKSYGFFHFLFDCFMVLITWGLWLIWIFVREMRKSKSSYPPYC